jgi:acyl-coenzyme A thioesterase PaaI-like protein
MSWAAIILTKRFILTKKMTIEFLRPVYIDSPLCGIAYIKKRNGERSALVTGELFDEQERLCATAQGEFVLFSKERFAKLSILPIEDLSAMAASFAEVDGEGEVTT